MGLDELKRELAKCENTWVRREVTAPEKARVMLMLISEARKVFSDEASRRRYDRELEESKRKPKETATAADPMKEKFDRFYSQAQGFYKTKQFDLAMTAI